MILLDCARVWQSCQTTEGMNFNQRAYTLFDESGTAQNFDIVPLSTHRQTYRQTDTLQHPRILISSHSGCPTLVKKRVPPLLSCLPPSVFPYFDFDLCANAAAATVTASTLLLLPPSASAFRSPRGPITVWTNKGTEKVGKGNAAADATSGSFRPIDIRRNR